MENTNIVKDNEELCSIKYGPIEVFYTKSTDGGGSIYESNVVKVIKKRFGKVNTFCEFGSGPGHTGFSLLAKNLCNNLVLIDINPKAIEQCNITIGRNHLKDLARTYISDVFKSIPSNEKWDLVYSNTPKTNRPENDPIRYDPDWKVHKEFYSNVKKFLNKRGSVLLLEGGSTKPEFWRQMIASGGLRFVDSFDYNKNEYSITKMPVYVLKRLVYRIKARNLSLRELGLYSGQLIKKINKENDLYYVWSENAD